MPDAESLLEAQAPPAVAPAAAAYVWSRGAPRRWSAEDFSRAHSWFARALAAAGTRPGYLVAIRLANRTAAAAIEAAALAMGASAWQVDRPWALAPEVLVTDPWTALQWPASRAPGALVLTEQAGAGDRALRQRIGEQWGRAPVIRQWYTVGEVPGPLAIECERGALHCRRPDDADGVVVEVGSEADSVPVGDLGPVVVTDRAEALRPLVRWDTGDVARVVACDCGHEGLALADVARADSRLDAPAGPVYPPQLLRALFRTPGFGGFAELEIARDRARGQDAWDLTIGVEPGWSERQVAEAAAASVAAVLHQRPRVAVDPDPGSPGLAIRDQRRRQTT